MENPSPLINAQHIEAPSLTDLHHNLLPFYPLWVSPGNQEPVLFPFLISTPRSTPPFSNISFLVVGLRKSYRRAWASTTYFAAQLQYTGTCIDLLPSYSSTPIIIASPHSESCFHSCSGYLLSATANTAPITLPCHTLTPCINKHFRAVMYEHFCLDRTTRLTLTSCVVQQTV